jgi:hypothetical protein
MAASHMTLRAPIAAWLKMDINGKRSAKGRGRFF